MGLFGKKKQVKATPKVQEWRFKLSYLHKIIYNVANKLLTM